jgi:N-acetylgalactosamine kinase
VDAKRFKPRSFRIGELLRHTDWSEWMDYINSATARQVREAYRGDWSNYARAAALRLQHACPGHMLRGMDCVVGGDIPMGAGLSSSSALVVALAEAAVALNGLKVTMQELVDLCGEGEWFVGSRGGSADHAAIRGGRRGRVTRIGFFPFRVEGTVALPEELALVIANSRVQACKSAGARDVFNHRVAAYELSEMLLRERAAILREMQHLRDVDDNALGVSVAEIYRALRRLPVKVTRREATRLLRKHRRRLEELFDTHRDVGPYRLREVAMYGVAECRRSKMFAAVLARGDLDMIGRLMQASHDGDRVVRRVGRRTVRFAPSYEDADMAGLIDRAAPIWAQPGRYACSTKEIDAIVDAAYAQEGVIGAQLAGAGLGGCAMVLARRARVEAVVAALRQNGGCEPHICVPVAGSGLLEF